MVDIYHSDFIITFSPAHSDHNRRVYCTSGIEIGGTHAVFSGPPRMLRYSSWESLVYLTSTPLRIAFKIEIIGSRKER